MPFYDYVCQACGRRIEVMHGVHATGPERCDACGGRMQRVISRPAIHFKGSGWAKMDARAHTAASGRSEASSAPAGGEDATTAAAVGDGTPAKPAAADGGPATAAAAKVERRAARAHPRGSDEA